MSFEIKRPKCCGECRRFIRSKKNSSVGYCDNWAGVQLDKSCVCHPNFGIRKEDKPA